MNTLDQELVQNDIYVIFWIFSNLYLYKNRVSPVIIIIIIIIVMSHFFFGWWAAHPPLLRSHAPSLNPFKFCRI